MITSQRSTRRSNGVIPSVRAPCLSSTGVSTKKKHKRRRGGKKRKRRAGARRHQSKCERLGKGNLRILYWNCSSLNERGVVAEKLAYSADVVCMQETNLGQYKTFKVLGFGETIYNRDHHGQVVIVRKEIKHKQLDVTRWSSDNLHLVAVELIDQPVRNVINVYACNNAVNENEWLALDDMQRTLPGETIFCGDFNARGSEWGNTRTNPQGIALENALDQCNLMCISEGCMTRMASRPGDSDSCIDLAITTMGIAVQSQWKVLGNYGSDHLPCIVYVKKGKRVVHVKRRRVFNYTIEENADPLNKLRKDAQKQV